MRVFVITFIFSMFAFVEMSGQTELWPKRQKLRAYTYPVGTVTLADLIGPNSKTYTFETPVFSEMVGLNVIQSKHENFNKNIINHVIGGQPYKEGRSVVFSLIFDQDDQGKSKIFISFPGRSIGQLNIGNGKVVKYKFFKRENEGKDKKNPIALLYVDDSQGSIEKKMKESETLFFKDSISEKKFFSEIESCYLIYYTYTSL